MTLPGVDVATAEAMMAAWGDVKRFPDGDHAASYLGLVPSTKQSANQCYHGPITNAATAMRAGCSSRRPSIRQTSRPLGPFLPPGPKKKNRNVAVVAGVWKLAMIGWQMLTKNEPYRYAIPRSTETKLSRLRVKATGQRRVGGEPKGVKSMAKLPGGSRTIKALPEVCRSEGLPAPRPLSAGERRTVQEADSEAFVAAIAGGMSCRDRPNVATLRRWPPMGERLFTRKGSGVCRSILPKVAFALLLHPPVSPASCGRAGGRGPSPCTPYPQALFRQENRKIPTRQLTRTEVGVVERAVAGHVAGRVVGRRRNAAGEVISLAAFVSRVCDEPLSSTAMKLPRPSSVQS